MTPPSACLTPEPCIDRRACCSKHAWPIHVTNLKITPFEASTDAPRPRTLPDLLLWQHGALGSSSWCSARCREGLYHGGRGRSRTIDVNFQYRLVRV